MSKPVNWPTVLSSVGAAVIVGFATIAFSYYQLDRTLNAEKMSEERKEVHIKLNEFYGPLLQLRMKSSRLYQKFSSKFKQADPNFSTLEYLLRGQKFSGNDKVLLEEILKIGEQCEKLIQDKAGLIDDANLRTNVIPRATAHFLILRLAYKGALKGDSEMYDDLVFPKDLDSLLEKRKKELEERLVALNTTK